MKTNFKRLFALVLTLCLLASLMVPVAFAEDEAVAAPSANVAETYPIRLKDLNHTDPATATGLDALLVKYSSTNQQYQYNGFTTAKLATAYTNGEVNWKFLATSNEWTLRSDRAYQFRLNKGWAAVQIRVENSGLYALNIATDKATYENWENETGAWAGKVTAYVIPAYVAADAIANAVIPEVAEGETAPTAEQVAIPTLMTEEYSVGTVAMAAEDTSVTFAKTNINAGEYVVVYTASGSNYTVSEMSLLGDAYELKNVAKYDMIPFDLTNADTTTWAGTVNESLLDDTGAMVSYVNPGTGVDYATYGWKSFSYNGTFRATAASMYAPSLKTSGSDWAAIVLNVPASGNMYLSMITDRSTPAAPFSNSYGAWEGNVTAYLIPMAAYSAAYTGSKKDTVAALMTDAYCVGTDSVVGDDNVATFAKTYMEAGEYILAYSFVGDSRYPVYEINLDKVVEAALPGNDKLSGTVATYDFEIYNNERYEPIFISGTDAEGNTTYADRGFSNAALTGLEGAYEAGEEMATIFNRDYASGIINYNLESWGTMNTLSYRKTEANGDTLGKGLRIQKKATTEAESAYAAFRLNVPAGALYTVDLVNCYNSVDTLNIYIFGADYEGTIADNMTEANLASVNATTFASVLAAGENIIVFEFGATTEKVTFNLMRIDLSVVANETVTYNFALPQNEAFMNAWYAANDGTETAIPASGPNMYKWTGTSATFYPYSAIAKAYVSGDINWALDASSGSNLSTNAATESKNFRVYDTSLRVLTENADATLNYFSFRLKVENPGAYDVTVNYSKASDSLKAYLFKAPNAYDEYSDRLYLGADSKGNERDASLYLTTYMTEENLVHSTSTYDAPEVNFNYTFEESGEYIIAFAPVRTDKTNSTYISSIVMEPVEINYIADGAGYATFEEAVAAATESIVLLQDTTAGKVVVPAGVTLDLNGFNLDAGVVEFAAAADIIDSTDGNSLLRVASDITFNENNAQLPLYNIDTNCYKLFNVEVESCATTGTGSSTKYWFKVNFANDAAFDLIGATTELRIMANMTGVIKSDSGNYVAGDEWAAVATADAAFTNSWADNNTSYIVVSAVGSNLSSFKLNPGVTANGVVISGDAMYKGSAT